jgi:hypothetical protein
VQLQSHHVVFPNQFHASLTHGESTDWSSATEYHNAVSQSWAVTDDLLQKSQSRLEQLELHLHCTLLELRGEEEEVLQDVRELSDSVVGIKDLESHTSQLDTYIGTALVSRSSLADLVEKWDFLDTSISELRRCSNDLGEYLLEMTVAPEKRRRWRISLNGKEESERKDSVSLLLHELPDIQKWSQVVQKADAAVGRQVIFRFPCKRCLTATDGFPSMPFVNVWGLRYTGCINKYPEEVRKRNLNNVRGSQADDRDQGRRTYLLVLIISNY